MSDHALDGLIRAVTIIFILSLATERMTTLFKSRNWQPLRRKPGKSGKSGRFIVDISRDTVVHRDVNGLEIPVLEKNLRKAHVQAVNSENTLLLGMLLALATGSNAFQGLLGPGLFSAYFAGHPVHGYLWNLPQILMTGAAAAIGSSFWYDMLGILMEVRRTKQSLALPNPEPRTNTPGKPAGPSPFQRLRMAAEAEVNQWVEKAKIKSGLVIDDPASPYLAVFVDPAPDSGFADKTMDIAVDGKTFQLPVHVKPKP